MLRYSGRIAALIALVGFAGVAGLGATAAYAGFGGPGWHPHHASGGFGAPSAEMIEAHVGHVTGAILDRLDASPDQRDGFDAVLDGVPAEMLAIGGEMRDVREGMREQLRDDPSDRAALEERRQQALRLVDRASAEVVGTLADLAEILSPDQRGELSGIIEEHHRGFLD
jgi:periplasmic protein CpxP/Spy